MYLKIKEYIWIILGVLALLLNGLFGQVPALYETIYFNFIFQIIRVVYDFTLGWIPVPMVYFLFFGLVHIIYKFFQFRKVKKSEGTWLKLKYILLPVFSFLGASIFFFYVLWGFNYQQKKLSDRLDFPKVKADTLELYEESFYIMQKMKQLRANISMDTTTLSYQHLPEGMESEIRESLERLLSSWNLPTAGRVRVRKLYPKGTLLRISTAGVYIPFVFEGHIDAGLHPISHPFIMAHEMSHGYGIADEGTCNFIGFLACMESEDSMIQYSATMSLWRYMANNLRRNAPSLFKKLMSELDANVRRDLIAVMDELDKYPDILPEVRDVVYDTYLKTHGVKGGMANYSTVVKLMMQWKKSDINTELKEKIYRKE